MNGRACLLLLLLTADAATAEPAPAVAASLRIIPALVRSGGPIPVEVALTTAAPALADGRLRIHLGGDGFWESEPCAVDRGGRTVRLLLPAASWLRPAWMPEGSDSEQPGDQVEVPEARLVAALCARPAAIPPLDPDFQGPIPQRLGRSPLAVEDCPVRAEGWCWASLAVIDQEHGDQLSSAQRQALAAWVAGGGSLWWLGDRPPTELALSAGDAGRRRVVELGRLVVGAPDGTDEAAEDHRHLLRLVRAPNDATRFLDPGQRSIPNPAHQVYDRPPSPPLAIGWALASFALFVAWATVGEWRLLRGKGRRWTWITLPAAAVAATGAAIAGVEWSLGDATWHRRTVIRDIGADGRILRELVFATRLWARPGTDAIGCGDGLLAWEGSWQRPVAMRVIGTGGNRRLEVKPQRWTPFQYRMTRFDTGRDDSGLAACTTRTEADQRAGDLLRAAGPGTRLRVDTNQDEGQGRRTWHDHRSFSRNLAGGGLDGAPSGSSPHLDLYLCHRDRPAPVLILTTPLPDGFLIRRRLLAADEP